MMLDTVWLCLFAFLSNVPCGYLRASARKFSFWWFFWIHLPVPFIYILRVWLALPLFPTIIFSILCYLGGQFLGKFLHRKRKGGKK